MGTDRGLFGNAVHSHAFATHFYDTMARLTKIADWISAAGIRYAHDDGSRLTSITDYDDSVLTYTYDAAGNDYHSNVTA